MEDESILSKLDDEKIFSIRKVDEIFVFTEECDKYFTLGLSRQDMFKLIKELQDLLK